MLTAVILPVCALVLALLTFIATYQWILAIASIASRRRSTPLPQTERTRFAILIPAYNEECGVEYTVRSLQRVDYPASHFRIFVVADRCTDATAARARACGAECLERTGGAPGKGPAIAWAIDRLRAAGEPFDALVIIDADTVADPPLLDAFDAGLRSGRGVQQGYNYLSNPWDSPFTRVIAVTSVLRNGLFYGGKERLGLPAMLTGTGMCLSRRILDERGWNAFSVGEDWELSASLLVAGEWIHFNPSACVRAAESRSFRQASSQRLRWASGRQAVAAAYAWRLVTAALRQRRPALCDAALTIACPTYSMQATMTIACIAAAWIAGGEGSRALIEWGLGVMALLVGYFAAGLAMTESPWRAVAGVALIPLFLPWRASIEVLGLLGYGRKHWVRTSRTVVLAFMIASAALAGRANAQVIFQDDFESDAISLGGIIGGWDGPHDNSVMYMTDRVAHSGHRSLEMKYLPGTQGSSFMYNLFLGVDAIHVRWYQRWSAGFVWEPSATKMVILRPMGGYPEFYPEVLWADGKLAIQAQVTREANWDSENFYQNVGAPVVFGGDRWYCIEVFVKLNTPGLADGQVKAWIDGELKLSYDGREFRGALPTDPAPSTAQIQAVGASGYYGGTAPVPQEQYAWQDDYVISTQPVGYDFLSDDFETDALDPNGNIGGWDGPARPSVMYATDQMVNSGARALQLDYAPGSDGAGYMYWGFHPQEQAYLRWYQRWSPGFVWEPSGTGLVGLKTSSGPLQFYPFAFGADGTFAIQAQVVAERSWGSENFFMNQGASGGFVPDRWYCIEVFVKLNTPGTADGQIAAWIDGERKLFYDARQFRGAGASDPAPPGSSLNALLITGQYGGLSLVPQFQSSWIDDFAASTERIGCQPRPPIVR